MDGSCFFIQSETLGAFRPFKFRVTIEIYGFSAIVLPVRSLFLYIFSVSFWSVWLSKSLFAYRIPLNISCRAGLVVTYSFSFCLTWKLFISPSILNDSLAGLSIPGCMFFSFSTLDMFCQPLLSWQVSVDRPDVILMFLPPYVRDLLSLATLRIVSLAVKFAIFTIIYEGVDLFLLILGWVLSASWTWMLVSFSRLGKFSVVICSNIPYSLLFLSTPLGIPVVLTLECFMASLIFPTCASSCLSVFFNFLPFHRLIF